jgi:hypothetical protein
MRKLFSISLITIHLFANTEVGQLFKIPQLISHYFQHSRIDPKLGFIEFLSMHYGKGDGTTADDSEDSKLPYQHPNTHSISYAYTAILKNITSLDDVHMFGRSVFGESLQNGIPSEHIQLILQPPRS